MRFSDERWKIISAAARHLGMGPVEYVNFCVDKVNGVVAGSVLRERMERMERALNLPKPQEYVYDPPAKHIQVYRSPKPADKKTLSHNPFASLSLDDKKKKP